MYNVDCKKCTIVLFVRNNNSERYVLVENTILYKRDELANGFNVAPITVNIFQYRHSFGKGPNSSATRKILKVFEPTRIGEQYIRLHYHDLVDTHTVHGVPNAPVRPCL